MNDHVLKTSGLVPSWVTGKLSDFAGLFFFPLLCTAIADTAAWPLRARVDPTLRLSKAIAALAFTGLLFASLELSTTAVHLYESVLARLGIPSVSVRDPWDLVALAVLPLSYLHARRHVRRVPDGRVAVALARRAAGIPIAEMLADVRRLWRDPTRIDDLVAALERAAVEPGAISAAEEALARVRAKNS
ncbi:MAG: hypothetical protein HYY06_09950 [Deltaproteobacteria bacterium]|nr:hypothetical protein [Deltaproteobacteria bacterium]